MWVGIVALCIAGTTLEDLPDTGCLIYQSTIYETKEQCDMDLALVLLSPEIQVLTRSPEYDLDLVKAECNVAL